MWGPPRRKPHPFLETPDPPPPQICPPGVSSQAPQPHSISTPGPWVPPSLPRPRPLLPVSPGAPGARPHPAPPRRVPRPDLLRALEADSALRGSEPAVQAAAERQGVQSARGRRRRRGRRRGSGPRLLVAGQAPGSRLGPVVLLFVVVAVPGRAAGEGRPAAAASPAPPGLRLGRGPPPARQHQQLQLVEEHAEPRLEHRPGAGGRRARGALGRRGEGRGQGREGGARWRAKPGWGLRGLREPFTAATAGTPRFAGQRGLAARGRRGGRPWPGQGAEWEGGSGYRAPRVRVRSGPGPRGYKPRSSCAGAAPHRRLPGPSPAPAPAPARPVRSAVANGGSFRRRRRRRPPRSGGRAGREPGSR